jgi:hypothetical protein
MRVRLWIGILGILALSAATANAQAQTGTIRVTVSVEGTQQPLAGVQLTLASPPLQADCVDDLERFDRECLSRVIADRPNDPTDLLAYLQQTAGIRVQPSSAVTDAAGTAIFQNVPIGQYGISTQHRGYVGVGSGPDRGVINILAPAAPSPIVTIHQKRLTPEVSLFLIPTGSLRGHVRDASGAPIRNARILLGTIQSENGRRVFNARTSVMTNAAGEYVLAPLSSGEYAIRVHAPPTPENALYFPGSADLEKAMPIHVGVGKDVTGIDVTLSN